MSEVYGMCLYVFKSSLVRVSTTREGWHEIYSAVQVSALIAIFSSVQPYKPSVSILVLVLSPVNSYGTYTLKIMWNKVDM